MAQSVEEILRSELGNLIMQVAIKEAALQQAMDRIKKLEADAELAKPVKKNES
jgi:hypothetical protein